MKKTLFTIEFIFVLILFVCPFFFSSQQQVEVRFVEMKASLSNSIMFFCALLLFVLNFQLYKEKQNELCEEKNMTRGISALKDFRLHCYVLTATGLIFLSSALCTGLEYFMAARGFSFTEIIPVMPSGLLPWISFFAAVLMSAFFEETIYRFFIPEGLLFICNGKFRMAAEICAVIMFSLGHRYLGIPGVLNAVLSGTVLRLLFVKTRSLWINTLLHAFYNSAVFIAAAVM